MNIGSISNVIVAASFLIPCTKTFGQAAAELALDPATSRVLWKATKVTGEHSGEVPVKKGVIFIGADRLVGAQITMDMTNITCIDIENEGANAKLVRHLKGADFFDVEDHNDAEFTTTSVDPIADAKPGQLNYRVSGDLKIKGVTRPNSFDCLFYTKDGTAHAAAKITFDRTEYGINYGSGSVFADLADRAISDDVSVTFDVTGR